MRIVPPFGAAKGFAATSSDPSKTAAAASAPGSCALFGMSVRVPREPLPAACHASESRIAPFDEDLLTDGARRW